MTEGADNRERHRRAYEVGGRHVRQAIAREAPDFDQVLGQVAAADIVVVRGQYDHVEWVLEALQLPHQSVDPHHLAGLPLRPEQLLVVNCPGQVGPAGVALVQGFVESGGSLFTTDWALRHVLEPAFPGVVAYNEQPTADTVVRVEAAAHDNPFLRGVMSGADDPIWWLEGSSYPIRVLDPGRVTVLISSRELQEAWGEAPVALTFRAGEGEVFHMISHYYLQRAETRTRRHRMPAAAYAAEKGVVWEPGVAAQALGLTLGEVEAAASSARLFANVVGAKKRRLIEAEARRRRAGQAPGRSAAAATSVTGKRDGEGKEGR